jgi:DNA-binding MarR family transcriptional regulator
MHRSRRGDGRDRRSVIVEPRPSGEALLRQLALYWMAEHNFAHDHRPRIR